MCSPAVCHSCRKGDVRRVRQPRSPGARLGSRASAVRLPMSQQRGVACRLPPRSRPTPCAELPSWATKSR